MEINGVAHVFVTVSNLKRSRAFYSRLLPLLGMKAVMDTPEVYYCIGGRTAFGLRECDPAYKNERFAPQRVGLHHLCFRARERDDIDLIHDELWDMSARIIHAPREDEWAPGYYSVLFEDPDGIRLEINHVPGKGLLAEELSTAVESEV
jgi:catechol 2,3-dioxygenase-like lactoylglutathione lyase family enzyme